MSIGKQPAPLVLFTSLRGYYLYSSQFHLMKKLMEEGVDVRASAADDDYLDKLSASGVKCHPVQYERGGLNPVKDFKTLRSLRRTIASIRPSLVHCFQPKPLIMTALCSGLLSSTKLITTITGLGELANLLTEGAMSRCYRMVVKKSLARCSHVFFLNLDDRNLLLEHKIVEKRKTSRLLGDGIDLDRFSIRSAHEGHHNSKPIRVLMPSRLLWNKGVAEYVEAARICRQSNAHATFEIAGELDPHNPHAIPEEWVTGQSDIVPWIGYVTDMPEKLRQVDILVLPSYREGMPRAVLEAAASGIPVITTDVPGCRDAVRDGQTGFLVPVRDAGALAKAIIRLVQDHDLRTEMGLAARRFAEECFDIRSVIDKYMDIYRQIGLQLPMEEPRES